MSVPTTGTGNTFSQRDPFVLAAYDGDHSRLAKLIDAQENKVEYVSYYITFFFPHSSYFLLTGYSLSFSLIRTIKYNYI